MFEGVEGVYLLHFGEPLHHARHYIGWSSNIGARLQKHQQGTSQVSLTRAVSKRGVSIVAVRVWEGKDRNFERSLKNRKKAWMMCPICNPVRWMNNGKGDEE